MVYVTVRQHPAKSGLTWEDLMMDKNPKEKKAHGDRTGTITRLNVKTDPVNVPMMYSLIKRFNEKYKTLYEADKSTLYKRFYIPKKSGGMRPIDEPCKELQDALRELKRILEEKFLLLYHTSAFAYVKKRNTIAAIKKHQLNKSNWFLKVDFSNFFNSTTLDYTMRMLEMIHPLNCLCAYQDGKEQLKKAISLAFLNDGLPQGTVISPFLSNVINIPLDYELFNAFAHHRYVYTRYADDILISSVQWFDQKNIIQIIKKTLKELKAPYTVNNEKTRYGSRKGKNFNLGVILNKDNDITVGWRAKQSFKGRLANFIMDLKHGKSWEIEEVEQLIGLMSYYKMVEPEYFENLIRHFNDKFNANLKECLRNALILKF